MTATAGLRPRPLRELRMPPAAHPRGQTHLSSASGLVVVGDRLYFVADDEHHLGALPLAQATGDAPVTLHRLRPDDLPQEAWARKARKPDCPHCPIRDLCKFPDKTVAAHDDSAWRGHVDKKTALSQ